MILFNRLFCISAAAVCFSGFAASLQASEYVIKFDRPVKVGQKYRMTSSMSDQKEMQIFINDKHSKTELERTKLDYVADITVQEVDSAGNSIKESHKIIRCEELQNEARRELLAAGKTLLVSMTDTGAEYTVDGTDVSKTLKNADDIIAPTRKNQADELMGNNSKRRIGETWPIDNQLLATAFSDKDGLFSKQYMTGQMKLASAGKEGKIDYLLLEGTIDVSKIDSPIVPELKTDKSSIAVSFSSKLPVDHNLPVLESTRKMLMNITASGMQNFDGVSFDMSIKMRAEYFLIRGYLFE